MIFRHHTSRRTPNIRPYHGRQIASITNDGWSSSSSAVRRGNAALRKSRFGKDHVCPAIRADRAWSQTVGTAPGHTDCWKRDDPFESYRKFYRSEKRSFAKVTKRRRKWSEENYSNHKMVNNSNLSCSVTCLSYSIACTRYTSRCFSTWSRRNVLFFINSYTSHWMYFCNVVRRKNYWQGNWKRNFTTYNGWYNCYNASVFCSRVGIKSYWI